jgi:hypothetical protein
MFHNFGLYDKDTLLFNSCFVDDEDIEYAVKHKFNVRYTDTGCTDTFNLISKFIDLGYDFKIIKEPYKAPDGLELEPKLIALFIYSDENKKKELL